MRHAFQICLLGGLGLAACNSAVKPSNENFGKAINEYLSKHGRVCASVGRAFPIDVPESSEKDQYGTGPQMAALERAGLVRSSYAVAGSPGILGGGPQRRVKRYVVTAEGKTYFQEMAGVFGKTGSFCYGQKTLDTIVDSSASQMSGAPNQALVSYTYRIVNVPVWAQQPDVQKQFGEIRTTLAGISKMHESIGVQMTDKGWVVVGQP